MFQPAEGEVGAAMRAMAIDQAVAAVLVAKQHQVFAEQFDRLTGRGPCSSSASAAGCQYIRISLPHGSFAPVRVIRSLGFLAHHGAFLYERKRIVLLLNKWANYQYPVWTASNNFRRRTPSEKARCQS